MSRASPSWAALVFSLIVLQSIAIPGTNVSSVFLLGTFFFGATLWFRPDSIDRFRLGSFLVAVTALCAAAFFPSAGGAAPSVASLALLLAHYWWFVPEVPRPIDSSRLAAVRAALVFCAAIGVLQFVVQSVVGYYTILDILPEPLRMGGFNTSYAIYYGAALKKANGYFFLEPSVFSQFMAIGILLEVLVFRRRGAALALLLLALLLSFSGTGIMLLLASGLVAAVRERKLLMDVVKFGALLAFALGLYAAMDFEGLQRAFLVRAAEFVLPGSSGHMRFVAPMLYVLDEFKDWRTILFGIGPGMALESEFSTPSLVPKLLVEYGLVGGIPLLALILLRLGGRHIPIWYKAMLIIFYWFLGGNLLVPVIILMVLLLHSSMPGSEQGGREDVASTAAR